MIILITASALHLGMGQREGEGAETDLGGGDSGYLSMWDSHAPTFNMINYPTINPYNAPISY
jgi:hypothetical protein